MMNYPSYQYTQQRKCFGVAGIRLLPTGAQKEVQKVGEGSQEAQVHCC